MGSISLSIPQIGQPDTTEDVKVANNFSAIQTAVNGNLDSTNLSASAAVARSQMAGGLGGLAWTSVSTNTSATDGHFYDVLATSTITLPTPTANVTVGVFVPGAAVATVTASSGVVVGLGLPAASSFTLGSVGSYAVLIANGTNWRIVSGQQDTGWVTMTSFPGGWTTNGPRAKLVGNRVYLDGSITNASGSTFVSGTIATIAASMKPTVAQAPIALINNAAVSIPISAASANITAVGVVNGATVNFYGISFPTD